MALGLGVLLVMLGWPPILFLADSPLFLVQVPQFTPPGVVQVLALVQVLAFFSRGLSPPPFAVVV
ncbi:hypothetical protein KY290_036800 [Solanum tuberosum]|uniref:Uncharacterized protein n=1 Tax=Solanum tuberosum TaxID=4113 RepID=A0ABQ7TXJ2_SOLTU|nr:hypothetical protein KY290_036800 [Solanum tuberosum]